MTRSICRIPRICPIQRLSAVVLLFLVSFAAPAAENDLQREMSTKATALFPRLEPLYKDFHSHPELSLQEKSTSQRVADELDRIGLKVTRRVGGYGVVGLLANGNGPTILIRTDLDALPIAEQTGASYASTVKATDDKGNSVAVMHACG